MNVPPHFPVPDPADLRWAALAEAETLGEPLLPHDLAFLRAHAPVDPALRAQQALREALHGWGEAPLPDEDDEAVLAAAVEAHLRAGASPASRRPRGLWVVAGGLAAAAAVVLGVVTWQGRPGSDSGSGSDELAQGPVPASAEAGEAEAGEAEAVDGPEGSQLASAEANTALRSSSGTWVDEDGVVLEGAPAPGTVLLAKSSACLGDDASGRLCVEPGARVRAVAADGPALEWLEGRGELVTPRTPTAVVLELRVAGTRVSGAGASVAVESTLDGRWSMTVREGRVELHSAEGTRVLSAGERWTPQPEANDESSSPRGSGPDAATLLQRARTARAEGAMADAAGHYRRLLRAHPRSPLAGPAWVALGQVELARGRARAALEAFDRYLQRGGSLAEEAAYGRIEALRALGRSSEQRAATERFLAKYPGSSYAAKLRRRP